MLEITPVLTLLYPGHFPQTFIDHVVRLKVDPIYRCEIEATVASINLSAWYQSPLWKQTTKLMRYLHPRCEVCGTTSSLQVHHKTYKHLGTEILHIEDLMVLCDRCHREAHDLPLFDRESFGMRIQ